MTKRLRDSDLISVPTEHKPKPVKEKVWANPPDANKEYILVYDLPDIKMEHIEKGKPYPVLVKQDTVVVNVRFRRKPGFMGDMLLFNVKETGEEFHTHYGYMFAENTPENKMRLTFYRLRQEEYLRAKKEMSKAHKLVVSIDGPFEGNNSHSKEYEEKVKT